MEEKMETTIPGRPGTLESKIRDAFKGAAVS